MSQEKSKTMPTQIFWGVKEVYYGNVQVENSARPRKIPGWIVLVRENISVNKRTNR